jgi:hypothetical protein
MDLIKKIKHPFKSKKYSNTNSIIRRVKLSKIYNKRIDVIYTDENIDFEKLKEFYK